MWVYSNWKLSKTFLNSIFSDCFSVSRIRRRANLNISYTSKRPKYLSSKNNGVLGLSRVNNLWADLRMIPRKVGMVALEP